MRPKKLERILRIHGYRLTVQRQAILKIIASSQDHLTPKDLYSRVHEEHPTVSLVTVYRMLDILDRLKLICRVHDQNNCRSYLLGKQDIHHHHIICSLCGTVVDFTNCDINILEKRLSQETGFRILGHLLEFRGLCQTCYKTRGQEVIPIEV